MKLNNKTINIGLTGGIGSGKSTVSSILKEKGIPIVDADIISRKVLDIYPEILVKVKKSFGEKFIDSSGNLKRRIFGNYIFINKEKRVEYEKIIIPYIIKQIFIEMDSYHKEGKAICVLDAPTLMEHKLHEKMDFNILVWVQRDVQIKRVMKRDNLTKDEVISRIKSQMDIDDKINLADFVIDNSKDINYTEKQVNSIILEITDNNFK